MQNDSAVLTQYVMLLHSYRCQVEIDEYQNYQKAVGALNEALNCLSKAKGKNQAAIEAKETFLKERMALVEKFAKAQRWVLKRNTLLLNPTMSSYIEIVPLQLIHTCTILIPYTLVLTMD